MKTPNMHGQSGQLIVEAVLIIVVFMAVVFSVASFFKSQEVLKELITGPWQNMAGMLENGVWGTPTATAPNHPNAKSRHVVVLGDPAQ